MPATVIIVRPTITREEEIKAFERISYTLEKIMAKEYGIKTKFMLTRIR